MGRQNGRRRGRSTGRRNFIIGLLFKHGNAFFEPELSFLLLPHLKAAGSWVLVDFSHQLFEGAVLWFQFRQLFGQSSSPCLTQPEWRGQFERIPDLSAPRQGLLSPTELLPDSLSPTPNVT